MAQAKAPAKKKAAPKKKAAAQQKASTDNKPAAQTADILVHCVQGERFCRAGRCFGPDPEPVTDYTPEQHEAWEAEEQLVVTPAKGTAS